MADTARARLHAGPPLDAPPAVHEVPVRYGGEDGPDLLDVARATGLDPRRVVELHAGREYTAFMLGFVPGFAYLGPLPPELAVGRRATPRTRVPAGAVAIASGQTAVYPAATPGGWHLIGRTTVSLFDPAADPPALHPARRPRPVRGRGDAARKATPHGARRVRAPRAAVIEVVEAGLLTTVQDAGRTGFRRWGVGAAGAMDERALFAANHAAGNAGDAAVLECTVAGPALRFVAARHFAVAGADLGAVLHRADLGSWHVPLGVRVRARAGNVLAFGAPRRGCRAYVAVAGGLDVPLVMGSRSTDLAGGFGGLAGRPLRAGDRLGAGEREGHRELDGRRPERSPEMTQARRPRWTTERTRSSRCARSRARRTTCSRRRLSRSSSPRSTASARRPTAWAAGWKGRPSRIPARPRSPPTGCCPAASRCRRTDSRSSWARTARPPAATPRSRP